MLKLRTLLISVMLLVSFLLNAQDLQVTFTASGASSTVDSVKATNLRTNHSVSLPGIDTLHLELSTVMSELSCSGKNGIVFPNPCNGTATLIVPSGETGTAILCLMNLSGQVLTRISSEIIKGITFFRFHYQRQVFILSVLRPVAGSADLRSSVRKRWRGQTGSRIREPCRAIKDQYS